MDGLPPVSIWLNIHAHKITSKKKHQVIPSSGVRSFSGFWVLDSRKKKGFNKGFFSGFTTVSSLLVNNPHFWWITPICAGEITMVWRWNPSFRWRNASLFTNSWAFQQWWFLVKYPIISLHPHSQNSHKTYKSNMFAAYILLVASGSIPMFACWTLNLRFSSNHMCHDHRLHRKITINGLMTIPQGLGIQTFARTWIPQGSSQPSDCDECPNYNGKLGSSINYWL